MTCEAEPEAATVQGEGQPDPAKIIVEAAASKFAPVTVRSNAWLLSGGVGLVVIPLTNGYSASAGVSTKSVPADPAPYVLPAGSFPEPDRKSNLLTAPDSC